jgi:uncharacterized membrane protein
LNLSPTVAVILAFGIGVVAGLRSMTAPAVVAWAAHLGVLRLDGTHLAFMGSTWAVALFTLGALGEYVADKLPNTPSRTAPVGLIARVVTGGICGACLAVAGGASAWIGAIAGAIGGIAGAFGGYQARTGLVRSFKVKDLFIAIPEDVIAIGLGILLVTRF